MAYSVFSDRRFLFYFEIWWLLVTILQYVILHQLNVENYYAITDAIASNVILGFLCFLLSNNMRFYLPRNEKYWYIIVSSLAVCLVWLIMLHVSFYFILPKDDPYIQFFKESYAIRFGSGFLLTSSITMFSLLLYSQQEQKELQARQSESEKLKRDAELYKLRQQLQPHFLFNSLNSISSLTSSNPEKARHMIQQLSAFLRGMLKKDEEKLISLNDELEYLKLYLDIEKVRFGHRLQTEIYSDESVGSTLLPPLILQPVVENAIKFGLYDTIDDVVITIRAESNDHHLLITIKNPFDPETGRPSRGTGFGLSSIRRRLYLLYSRNDLVHTQAEGNIFTTRLIIPQV